MNSKKTHIIHDHIYISKDFERENNCNDESKNIRRIIRKKSDIETDEDREEYNRWRRLNNLSCRISRLHRQTKVDTMIDKCLEYEDLNMKLTLKNSILIQVIDQLKEHLRSLVPKNE